MKITSTRPTSLLLALVLLLTSCGGGGTSAATMHLRKTEGTVGVSDSEGKDVTPRENLGLYSGYQVGTQAESYAWIDLDEVKLTKMDADSEVEITKEGKKLEINVKSGSLFFNVTEPLADDETINIVASTMVIGVRGTCGWVTEDTAALLEGTVTVTAGDQEVTVNAGEMAVLTEDETLEVKPFTANDVPAFVREEIAEDEDLAADIQDTTGMDLTGADPMAPYAESLAQLDEVVYAEFVDFAQDGSPELLVIGRQTNEEVRPSDTQPKIQTIVYPAVSEENSVSWLMNEHTYYFNMNYESYNEEFRWSLVELDGRIFLKKHHIGVGTSPDESETADFMGFNDEGEWSNERVVYVVRAATGTTCTYESYVYGHYDEKIRRDIDAGEFTAVQAKYREVEVLAHRLNDGPVIAGEP